MSRKTRKAKRSNAVYVEKKKRTIYCIGCERNVTARLTGGQEIYPHRRDLFHLPFWICDQCHCFVGCHHKTNQRTRPVGCLADEHMREARSYIHQLIDEILKHKKLTRRALYSKLSQYKGKEYHTGELRSIEEARDIYRFLLHLKRTLS